MRIGLIIGTLEDKYCNRIAEFITHEFLLDARLMVFDCDDFDNDMPESYLCSMLCRIAESECLDGLIIVPGTFLCQNIGKLILELIKKTSKPIVSIGLPIDGIPSLILDNNAAFEEIINHFILHNIKNLAYISGPLSNPVYDMRYEAFLNSIKKLGLSVSPDLILEGTGSYVTGYSCAKKLAPLIRNGTVEGVICADDNIALSAIRYFAENNIDVPGNVKVTGFDNTSNTYNSISYLTTIDRDLKGAFKKSLTVLFEQIFGNSDVEKYYLTPKLITGITCGCEANVRIENNFYIPWTRFCGFRGLNHASAPNDMISRLTKYLNNNDVSQFFIVNYCDPIVFDDPVIDYETLKGTLYYGLSKGKDVTFAKPFPVMDLLPSQLLNKIEEPMLIRPIFFNNISFGYLLISVSKHSAQLINDLGDVLCRHFSSLYYNEECQRLKKENAETHESLMRSNKLLNELTVKDNLDKLLNIRFLASNMLQKRQGTAGEYIIIIVEIENYYEINERYGFSEGEYVISSVSKILAGSIREDDYLSHQSFERYILLVKNIQSNPIQALDKRFKAALDELNRTNGKPYNISICWGHAPANMESNIDDVYIEAEKKLFEVKQKKSTISPV